VLSINESLGFGKFVAHLLPVNDRKRSVENIRCLVGTRTKNGTNSRTLLLFKKTLNGMPLHVVLIKIIIDNFRKVIVRNIHDVKMPRCNT